MLIWLVAAGVADAEPMKLGDDTSRWIGVRFEVSPGGRPGQRDTTYSERFPAWLEADEQAGLVRVTIASEIVERHLLSEQRPVSGSFSDFVWVFDAQTGEVRSASFRGKLIRRIGWGIISSEVETEISVDMSTLELAGYEMPRRIFANTIFPYCAEAAPRSSDCTLVTPSAYQAHSGYVNAVGGVAVSSKVVTVHTFSPLGEAIFTELPKLPEWPDFEVQLTRPTPRPGAVSAREATLLGENVPVEY